MNKYTAHTMEFIIRNRYGDEIRGNVHLPDNVRNSPIIILCHGFKGFKDWGSFPYIASYFAECGWIAIRFNFSLNGIGDDPLNFTELDRFQKNTFTRELDDLDDLITEISRKRIVPEVADAARLVLIGHSRGGGISIIKTSEDDRISAIVSWASVATFDRWGDETKKQWRDRGYLEVLNTRTKQKMPIGIGLLEDIETNAERLNIINSASKLTVPFFIVHGEQDISVPVNEGYDLFEAAAKENSDILLIPKTDHTFGAVHPFEGPTQSLKTALEKTNFWLQVKLKNPDF